MDEKLLFTYENRNVSLTGTLTGTISAFVIAVIDKNKTLSTYINLVENFSRLLRDIFVFCRIWNSDAQARIFAFLRNFLSCVSEQD